MMAKFKWQNHIKFLHWTEICLQCKSSTSSVALGPNCVGVLFGWSVSIFVTAPKYLFFFFFFRTWQKMSGKCQPVLLFLKAGYDQEHNTKMSCLKRSSKVFDYTWMEICPYICIHTHTCEGIFPKFAPYVREFIFEMCYLLLKHSGRVYVKDEWALILMK